MPRISLNQKYIDEVLSCIRALPPEYFHIIYITIKPFVTNQNRCDKKVTELMNQVYKSNHPNFNSLQLVRDVFYSLISIPTLKFSISNAFIRSFGNSQANEFSVYDNNFVTWAKMRPFLKNTVKML